ncbi:MAG: DUF4403 family protein [Paludibacter sp.]|nr:DUF4403 family protein [Paludibacter sp.]
MKKYKSYLAFIAILLILSSCKTLQIEKPVESYLPSDLSPAVSEFPIKVDLDVKKLEKAINANMKGLIYEGSNISDKDLQIKVWKVQDFSFNIVNNVIEFRVPLKLWSRFTWKVEKFGLSIGDQYDAQGSIVLKYKTSINITKDWKLKSQTSSNGFEWIQTPQIKAVGINVPVTPIANLALTKCEKLISDQIDKSLAESVDLKKYISEAWSMMQKPMLASEENELWVRITPKDLYVSPFTTTGTKLNLAVAVYGLIESYMGAEPASKPEAKLPDFKMVNRPAQQFNLNIATDVTFDKISKMAKEKLLNKTFTQGNKSITITDLSIFGSEGKAIFVADVTGALKGRIYFKGNMTYNPDKVAVEITEPEFDIKTKNALVKSANWLLHGIILNQLIPYLTYPVADDLNSMKMEMNKTLSNYPVYNGITLQGALNSVSVKDLNLVPGALRLQANVKGNISIKIEDLKF